MCAHVTPPLALESRGGAANQALQVSLSAAPLHVSLTDAITRLRSTAMTHYHTA